jgi:hypothetical protein
LSESNNGGFLISNGDLVAQQVSIPLSQVIDLSG